MYYSKQNKYSRSYQNPRNRGNNRSQKQWKFDMSLLTKRAEYEKPEEYTAKHAFTDFKISDRLKENIKYRGYSVPTPIQDQTIPYILENRDVVGIANTGTGKTAAFLVPLLNKISENKSTKVLIVTPTRELAAQIQDECRAFSSGLHINSVLCIGGVNIRNQIRNLRYQHNIVIGTPGRLKDLFNNRAIIFALYNTIVLDEVDRMLDMGFIADIKFIVSELNKIRQSLFFSATINPSVKTIMHSFLKNPIEISVKTRETPLNVDHDIIKTNGRIKTDVLQDLLKKEEFNKVLIFGRTKWGIERLSKLLAVNGFKVASIHGNKNQNQRQRALDAFKQNQISILLATDIASRGLDIDDVSHVINFDLPQSYNDYIHRIGRTGRADKKGIALSFID